MVVLAVHCNMTALIKVIHRLACICVSAVFHMPLSFMCSVHSVGGLRSDHISRSSTALSLLQQLPKSCCCG